MNRKFGIHREPTSSHESGVIGGPVLWIIGILGVLTAVIFGGWSQIVKTNVLVTMANKNVNLMLQANRILATEATSDTSGYYLPPPAAFNTGDPTKLPLNYAASGGGLIPATSGAPKTDAWGRAFIYCSWNQSGTTAAIQSNVAFVVISAGASGNLQTTCAQAAAGTPQGDNRVEMSTVAQSLDYSSQWTRVSNDTIAFGAQTGNVAKVGVNTTTPQANWDVNGDAHVSGNLVVDQAISGLSLTLSTALPILSGGTGATTAPAARQNLGSGTTGDSLFTAGTPASARLTLGSGTIGDQLFQAGTVNTALTDLGGTTIGQGLFLATTASSGRSLLGSQSVGDAVFTSATTAAAQSAMGLGTIATQNANAVAITGGTLTGVVISGSLNGNVTGSIAGGSVSGTTGSFSGQVTANSLQVTGNATAGSLSVGGTSALNGGFTSTSGTLTGAFTAASLTTGGALTVGGQSNLGALSAGASTLASLVVSGGTTLSGGGTVTGGALQFTGQELKFFTASADTTGSTGILANPNGWTRLDPNGSRFVTPCSAADQTSGRNVWDFENPSATHLLEFRCNGAIFALNGFLGNASSATVATTANALTTAHNFSVGGSSGLTAPAVSFNGTQDVALQLSGVLSVANGGTGSSTAGGGPWVQRAGDTMTGTLNGAGGVKVGQWSGSATYSGIFGANMSGQEYLAMAGAGGNGDLESYFGARAGGGVHLRPNANDSTHELLVNTSGAFYGGSQLITAGATNIGRVFVTGPNYGSYGSIGASGSTNGYSGISFSDAAATLMVQNGGGYSGLFRNNTTWAWGFDPSGTLFAGSVPWGLVSGRPTDLGSFTNSPGYLANGSTPTFADAYVNNWFRVNGGGGIFWQAYGGGWYMADTTFMRVYQDKNVYTGAGYYGGGFFYNSDRSLKHNIQPLEASLEKVRKLRGVSFDWNRDGRADIGVVAQEVQQIFPQIIGKSQAPDGKETLTVEYGNLVAPLIESVKTLADQQDALVADVRELRHSGPGSANDNVPWLPISIVIAGAMIGGGLAVGLRRAR